MSLSPGAAPLRDVTAKELARSGGVAEIQRRRRAFADTGRSPVTAGCQVVDDVIRDTLEKTPVPVVK